MRNLSLAVLMALPASAYSQSCPIPSQTPVAAIVSFDTPNGQPHNKILLNGVEIGSRPSTNFKPDNCTGHVAWIDQSGRLWKDSTPLSPMGAFILSYMGPMDWNNAGIVIWTDQNNTLYRDALPLGTPRGSYKVAQLTGDVAWVSNSNGELYRNADRLGQFQNGAFDISFDGRVSYKDLSGAPHVYPAGQ